MSQPLHVETTALLDAAATLGRLGDSAENEGQAARAAWERLNGNWQSYAREDVEQMFAGALREVDRMALLFTQFARALRLSAGELETGDVTGARRFDANTGPTGTASRGIAPDDRRRDSPGWSGGGQGPGGASGGGGGGFGPMGPELPYVPLPRPQDLFPLLGMVSGRHTLADIDLGFVRKKYVVTIDAIAAGQGGLPGGGKITSDGDVMVYADGASMTLFGQRYSATLAKMPEVQLPDGTKITGTVAVAATLSDRYGEIAYAVSWTTKITKLVNGVEAGYQVTYKAEEACPPETLLAGVVLVGALAMLAAPVAVAGAGAGGLMLAPELVPIASAIGMSMPMVTEMIGEHITPPGPVDK
jgi:hypothetical protein